MSGIVGNHIGVVAAIQGNHIGTPAVAAIQGNHIGTMVVVSGSIEASLLLFDDTGITPFRAHGARQKDFSVIESDPRAGRSTIGYFHDRQ